MNRTLGIAASIVFVSAIPACGREPATDTEKPASPNTTAPAPVVPLPAASTTQPSAQSAYSPELERLLKASQGLRSVVQTLA